MSGIEKAQIIPVRNLPNGSERIIQDLIAEDPSVLGIGNLVLRDKERTQSSGGRLDILLEDAESGKSWYEVEIQLGTTNETHIIRTIEYWDREQRRYPDIRHTAVIVAEEINGRFFNVISLFNRHMPIIAIKVVAFKVGAQFGVLFTKILDYEPKAGEPEDASVIKADKAYWEQRCSLFALKATESLIEFSAKTFDNTIEAKYNKPYIGTTISGRVSNFVTYTPQKRALRMKAHCKKADDLEVLLDEAVIRWEYDNGNYPGYRLILSEGEISQHDSLIKTLMKRSYKECEGEDSEEAEAQKI